MPHVTTILGNEAGIQYQGVKDASSVLGVPLINGLIVGQFKRGRMDRPMTITLENIRGTLGHDPDNPDYIAVMDALSAGVPSVQVMRVNGGDGGGDATCAWIKSSDFSRVIDSWMTSGFSDVRAVAYMDSLQQFNSTIDQIQSIKSDFFHPIEQANILSIDYSPWLDAIKAEAKQQVSDPAMPFQVFVTEDYLIEDMSAPQPIMDALNALSPYIEDTVYYARVVAYIQIRKTVENQYIVGVFPMIEFLNHDRNPVQLNAVEVIQACFKGGNIAAFKSESDFVSPTPTYLKQPDSVLSLSEGTKWLKSKGGFTTIDCVIPPTAPTGGVVVPVS
ncbi:hypothetical protein [Acinetobacter indicus]|uniref:hypothetical protein n=1 Tax=Acinetobacter indicus TaxID=756892 RepID=UPI00209A915B|nr:hypothetical protein [Acinetobacter indicus]MCO8088263.1 hypothetical protein [Acinetobacter indicus]